jgi:serine/threonine protein kinase
MDIQRANVIKLEEPKMDGAAIRKTHFANSLQSIPRSTLEIGKPLGSGSFGTVSRATWDGTDVAIKELFLTELSDTLREEFDHEVSAMAQCNHPNIVGLYGVCDEAGHKGLVIEYMPGGSLRGLLENRKHDISWDTRWAIAIDIGSGLHYLHDRGIVHRDLKSLNILLTADLQAKIGDSGLAKIKLETSSRCAGVGKGTVRWRAPESFKRGFNATSSMDVYSYGMVLWEIASREIPFADATDELTVISWIKDGEQEKIPDDCPMGFGEVISQTWLDAQKRPCAEEVIKGLIRAKSQPASAPVRPLKQANNQNKEKSWHFDPATERRAGLAQGKQPYQLLDATDKDKQKVISFYQHHPVPGYQIASVQVIYNRDFNVGFEVQLKKMQQREGKDAFAPTWSKENNPEWRAITDRKLRELARPHADPDYPAVNIVPQWHGTRREILDSLFSIGYVNLATTDSGFYGKGLYGAHEAEYSYRVYGPGSTPTPAEGALILNWVASFSAYPVIDGDRPKLQGKGNYQNYDAHFVPVMPADPANPNEFTYFPCPPYRESTYNELVTFESASCLPRYLVELQPDLVKSPAMLPPHPGQEAFRTGLEFYRGSKFHEALPHFEQSAASEYPPAYLYLYLIDTFEWGVSSNMAKSDLWYQGVLQHAAWFREQAATGQAEAQLNLAFCYQQGIGVTTAGLRRPGTFSSPLIRGMLSRSVSWVLFMMLALMSPGIRTWRSSTISSPLIRGMPMRSVIWVIVIKMEVASPGI